MKRRDFLTKVAGTGVVAGLAGCGNDEDDSTPDPRPGPAPETDGETDDGTPTSDNDYECLSRDQVYDSIDSVLSNELTAENYTVVGSEEEFEIRVKNDIEESLEDDSELEADEVYDMLIETEYGSEAQSNYEQEVSSQVEEEIASFQIGEEPVNDIDQVIREDYEQIRSTVEDEISVEGNCDGIAVDKQYTDDDGKLAIESIVEKTLENQELEINVTAGDSPDDNDATIGNIIGDTETGLEDEEDLDRVLDRAEIASNYDDPALGTELIQDYFSQQNPDYSPILTEKEADCLSRAAREGRIMPDRDDVKKDDWSGYGIDNETMIDLHNIMDDFVIPAQENDYFDPVQGEELVETVMSRGTSEIVIEESGSDHLIRFDIEKEGFGRDTYNTKAMQAGQVKGMMERAIHPLTEAYQEAEDEVKKGVEKLGEITLGLGDAFAGEENVADWTETREVEGSTEAELNPLAEAAQRLTSFDSETGLDEDAFRTVKELDDTIEPYQEAQKRSDFIEPLARQEAAKFTTATSNKDTKFQTLNTSHSLNQGKLDRLNKKIGGLGGPKEILEIDNLTGERQLSESFRVEKLLDRIHRNNNITTSSAEEEDGSEDNGDESDEGEDSDSGNSEGGKGNSSGGMGDGSGDAYGG